MNYLYLLPLMVPAAALVFLVVMVVRQRKVDRLHAQAMRLMDAQIERNFGELRARLDQLKRR